MEYALSVQPDIAQMEILKLINMWYILPLLKANIGLYCGYAKILFFNSVLLKEKLTKICGSNHAKTCLRA